MNNYGPGVAMNNYGTSYPGPPVAPIFPEPQRRPSAPPGNYLAQVGQKAMRAGSHFHKESMAVLVLCPLSAFVITSLFCGIPPQGWLWRALAALVFIAFEGFAAVLTIVHFTGRKGPIYLYSGLLCALAAAAGYMIGMQVWDSQTSLYWMRSTGETYSNIPASTPSAAMMDASVIKFATDTRIDLRRVLGFRPQATTDTFCVAPVLASGDQTKVQFWAVGLDCCEPLRSFQCGESSNPLARSGIVQSAQASKFAATQHANYLKAAQQAAAHYGLTTPEDPVFVTWVQDPAKSSGSAMTSAVLQLMLMSILYGMMSTVVAAGLHLSSSFRREHDHM